MQVDLIFPTFNRFQFSQTALAHLFLNTNWDRVRTLYVYDDGSTDGTREWLETALLSCPGSYELRAMNGAGPVGIMAHHLSCDDIAPLFAKVDNDIVVPPGWLDAMLSVLEAHPEVELLGMEAGMTRVPYRDGVPWDGVYGWRESSHIGGVGVMRVSAFERRPALQPKAARSRFGFTEWQHAWTPVRGWIEPDLAVVQLDRLPHEPWASLSKQYVGSHWQRPSPTWDPAMMGWAYEHLNEVAA